METEVEGMPIPMEMRPWRCLALGRKPARSAESGAHGGGREGGGESS